MPIYGVPNFVYSFKAKYIELLCYGFMLFVCFEVCDLVFSIPYDEALKVTSKLHDTFLKWRSVFQTLFRIREK